MDIKFPLADFRTAVKALVADGMSRKEIAAEVGVSLQAICDIYTGKTLDPRVSVADGIRKLHAERLGSVSA